MLPPQIGRSDMTLTFAGKRTQQTNDPMDPEPVFSLFLDLSAGTLYLDLFTIHPVPPLRVRALVMT